MKLLSIFAVLLASSCMTVKADLPLADAMVQLRQVLRLSDWIATWNVLRNSDWEVCLFSNDLNRDYPAAFASILSDPLYVELADYMSLHNVQWDQFVQQELKPALGFHDIVPSCTTLSNGGVESLRSRLLGYFDTNLVESTLIRLRSESSAMMALHLDIQANQEGVHRIRCAADVQTIFGIMGRAGVDFQVIFEIIFQLFFAWTPGTTC